MERGNWKGEAWPGPERARQRLPRLEDLPVADNGYDRERVREAFDSFYRHLAQLDSTLRALEAVEVFRDQAGELRRELRALKAAGWTQQPWPSYGRERVSPGIPEAVPRFAIEAAFLIVVAVVVAVAGFDRLSIVLVMALAWAIVGVVEWAASRERFARARVPVPVSRAAAAPAQPAPLRVVTAEATPAESWAAQVAPARAEASEGEDEHTIVRPAAAEEPAAEAVSEPVVSEAPAPEPAEPAREEPEADPEADPEAVEEAEPVAAVAAEHPAAEAADAEAEPAAEPEPEPEPEPSRWSWAADATVERARERALADRPPEAKRRFWQRRRRDSDGVRLEPAQPRHVRVLPPEPSFDERFPVEPANGDDPWERDIDLSIEEPEGTVGEAEQEEREAALDHERS